MDEISQEIIKACKREGENCLYTSTIFLLWLSVLRRLKAFFITVPLLLGGFTGVDILSNSKDTVSLYFLWIFALLASVIPSIYSALKIETRIEELDKVAGQYKILEGKFRRLINIESKNGKLKEEFDRIILELEQDIQFGRDVQFKLTTANGAVFVGTIIAGQQSG